MIIGPFTVMRELTEAVDRICEKAVDGGNGSSTLSPEIEIRRRNGVYRLTAQLPEPAERDVRAFVEGKALVLLAKNKMNGNGGSHGEPFRTEVLLPANLDPADVSARFFEGSIIVEIPFGDTEAF